MTKYRRDSQRFLVQRKVASEAANMMRMKGAGFDSASSKAHAAPDAIAAAKEAICEAEQEIVSGAWDLIILDEINYAVKFGLLETEDVLRLVNEKPRNLHLVLTGRDAAPELVAAADLVTEMKLVKHPFQKGIKAQLGIEF